MDSRRDASGSQESPRTEPRGSSSRLLLQRVPLERRRSYPAQPLEVVNSPVRLYNLVDDLREERDVAPEHPDVVARLLQLAQTARRELGDLDVPGTEVRPAGWVFQPRPPLLSPN